MGSADTHDRLVRELTVGSDAAVVFVNYSRSPEARFPEANEEAFAATQYIAEHGADFNLDVSHLSVVGDSSEVTWRSPSRSWPKSDMGLR